MHCCGEAPKNRAAIASFFILKNLSIYKNGLGNAHPALGSRACICVCITVAIFRSPEVIELRQHCRNSQ
jgi:hypothetical protein